MTETRTLVTGTTGLLGNNILRTLLRDGTAVRVLVREHSDPQPLEALEVEKAIGDVRDAAAVRRACEGVDCVIHAAGWVRFGWSDGDLAREVNVDGTRNVVQAAREVGARLVHVSSINALAIGKEDDPADEETPYAGQIPCPYMVSKREAQQFVLRAVDDGLDAVVVHPGLMFGPWDWKPSSGQMVLAVGQQFTPFAPRGGISVCDVRDVADGVVVAARHGTTGRGYILAGHNMRYLDVWNLIADITGGSRPWMCGPGSSLAWAGKMGDFWTHLSGREPEVNSAGVGVANQFHYYRSDRAIEELGYRIRPAREAIEASWHWLQQVGYKA